MCRLAFIPGKSKIGKTQLFELLENLEWSCGGDGNGFVAISADMSREVHQKSLKLPNDVIVNTVYPLIREGWSVYYHTRKISIGWAADEQCHPFKIRGKKFSGYLAHNGTWGMGQVLASYLGVGSDTAAIANVVGKFGTSIAIERGLFPTTGVFLLYGGHKKETPTHNVMKLSGELEYCPRSKIWASEFTESWRWEKEVYEVPRGSYNLLSVPKRGESIAQSDSRVVNYPSVKTRMISVWNNTPGYNNGSYEIDFDAIDKKIDSTWIDRNLLSEK